jgi:hypothetical protein
LSVIRKYTDDCIRIWDWSSIRRSTSCQTYSELVLNIVEWLPMKKEYVRVWFRVEWTFHISCCSIFSIVVIGNEVVQFWQELFFVIFKRLFQLFTSMNYVVLLLTIIGCLLNIAHYWNCEKNVWKISIRILVHIR